MSNRIKKNFYNANANGNSNFNSNSKGIILCPKKTNQIRHKVMLSRTSPNDTPSMPSMPSMPIPKTHANITVKKSEFQTNISCFEPYDKTMVGINNLDEKLRSLIYDTIISNEEYDDALNFVCNKEQVEKTSWFAIEIATDLVYDKRRMANNLEPIHSCMFNNTVIVNSPISMPISVPIQKETIDEPKDIIKLIPAPFIHTIALIKEWQDNKQEWHKELVAIIRNPLEFWEVIKQLNGNNCGSESRFALPLPGKDSKAENIFQQLLSSGKRNEDTVKIDGINQKNIGKIVAEYNKLFYIWTFVKVSDDITMDNIIESPFIRDSNQRAINCMDINLKDTKVNAMSGIRPMDEEFVSGYIPRLVMEFVGGVLPADISAIVFNKTIAINGCMYFKGYRVRVVTSVADPTVLTWCRKFMETEFVKPQLSDICDISKCVVRISLPK
jgi:hypothetical protein